MAQGEGRGRGEGSCRQAGEGVASEHEQLLPRISLDHPHLPAAPAKGPALASEVAAQPHRQLAHASGPTTLAVRMPCVDRKRR